VHFIGDWWTGDWFIGGLVNGKSCCKILIFKRFSIFANPFLPNPLIYQSLFHQSPAYVSLFH